MSIHDAVNRPTGADIAYLRVPRRTGIARDATGLGPHDHLCWSYEDRADFRIRAGEFLADGLDMGQQVCLVGSGGERALEQELATVRGWAQARRSGAAQVTSLDSAYDIALDSGEQVRRYAAATQRALTAGFTGFRVAADCTAVVRTPEQLDAFARYEHSVDEFMVRHPFSAMCAYDRRRLGDRAVAHLACLHPTTNVGPPGFRLHTTSRGIPAVSGELDFSTEDLLTAALARVDLRPDGDRLVIDASGLQFIDHSSLMQFARYAERQRARLVLRTSCPFAARIVETLGLPNVQLETA